MPDKTSTIDLKYQYCNVYSYLNLIFSSIIVVLATLV